jgi:hypothetical protein
MSDSRKAAEVRVTTLTKDRPITWGPSRWLAHAGGGTGVVLLVASAVSPLDSIHLSAWRCRERQEDTGIARAKGWLRIRRLSEDDPKFLHLAPLPRCANLFT